ncbi:Serine/threonine-protein kinase 17A, partial [Taenia solium]
LSGISPFAGDTQVETFQNILECSVTFDREEFLDTSMEARDFITRLLRKNPRKRDTASECLRHPWVATTSCLRCMHRHGLSVKVWGLEKRGM